MADPVEALWGALHGHVSPVVVVLYPDFGERPAIEAELISLATPGQRVVEVEDVEAALAAEDSALVLLRPRDERGVVEDCDGSRDRFIGRTGVVVLLLHRDGDGLRRLADLPSLASWLRGSIVDPDGRADIDEGVERRAFEAQTGVTPEQWLEAPPEEAELGPALRARLLER